LDVSEQVRTFEEFFEKHYLAELLEKIRKGKNFIVIDFLELSKFNPELASLILDQPEEVLKTAEIAIRSFDLPETFKKFHVRLDNLPRSQKIPIREIRSIHLSKLMFIEGIVRQKSDVRPQVTSARFECPSCGNVITVLQLEAKFKEPTRCGCGRKGKFRLLSKELVDAQKIVLEESPEELDGGQPKRMDVFLKNDLVSPLSDKRTNPGTKICVVGELKEVPIPSRDGGQLIRYDLMIDANHSKSIEEDYLEINISDDEKKEIQELARNPKIFDMLRESLAPSIYGHDTVKEAIVLQLLGGVLKVRNDGVKTRGDMHILLIGDPGSGKSQLIKRAQLVAPKSRYVSGKGASGAGLTAAVVKDEFLKGWALEAGALVLANKGFCVTKNTNILVENNQILTAKEIYNMKKGKTSNKNLKLISFNDKSFSIKKNKLINVSKRKANEVFCLEFESGDLLEVTGEHPLPVWDNGLLWKEVKDINTSELIIDFKDYKFPKKKIQKIVMNNTDENIMLTEDFLEFMGLIVTDGHISLKKYKVTFYSKSEELLKRFEKLSQKLFKKQVSFYTDTRSRVKQAYFCSKEIVQKLNYLGIPKGNKTKKQIDLSIIKNLAPNLIKSFLVGVINGDGSISNRKSGGCIDIVSGNKEFIKQLKLLFRKIGIIGKVSSISHTGGGVVKKGSYKIFKLTITGVGNIVKIKSSKIVKNKKDKLKQICSRFDNYGCFKKIGKLIKNVNLKLKKNHKKYFYENNIRLSRLNKLNISRTNLKKAVDLISKLDYMKNCNSFKLLKLLCLKNIYFNKIIAKQNIGSKIVYNLEVEHDNTYFANFIPVHNCMIDEMDKMSKEDQSAMHEALEQQTVTIAKANIQATLRCETTVLAAANPKWGRFDPYEIIAKQIDLPPALISRFDLIFPIRDLPDREKDTRLASFILKLHQDRAGGNPPIATELLKKYLAYSRRFCHPALTTEALEEIQAYYVEIRNKGGEEGGVKSIPITARQLEALVRLAEASARSRLAEKVTQKDSKKAIELLHYCMSQVGVDPETGKIDIDVLTTGVSSSARTNISTVKEVIHELENKVGKTIPIDDIVKGSQEKGIDVDKVDEIIEKLKRAGDIFEPRRGFIQRI
jgi:replicative DNA helicase Mcm